MSDFAVLIPARYNSKRFPGKVLCDIGGRSMIEHVWRCAVKVTDEVFVLTDDVRVREAGEKFGARIVDTSAHHVSGTSRTAEAAELLKFSDSKIVVNLQGDEPLIFPSSIVRAAQCLKEDPDCEMASLYQPMESAEEALNVNVVKVLLDRDYYARYFSRSLIPYNYNHSKQAVWLRHIGIYAYRVSLLKRWGSLGASSWEEMEKLEQLRALEAGVRIRMAQVEEAGPGGVDTPEDLERIRNLIEQDNE